MRSLSTRDRKFLARVAAVNTVLGEIALPIIEDTITPDLQARLGRELVEIGHELLRRSGSDTASELIGVNGNPGSDPSLEQGLVEERFSLPHPRNLRG